MNYYLDLDILYSTISSSGKGSFQPSRVRPRTFSDLIQRKNLKRYAMRTLQAEAVASQWYQRKHEGLVKPSNIGLTLCSTGARL
jgi:hypothetical protein